ncbi:MAG: DUF3526 domain-containing protein [Bacteroidota bacterium]
MLRTVLAHEWRLLRRTPATYAALALLATSILFGAYNAGRWADVQRDAIAQVRSVEAETFGEMAREVAALDGEGPGGWSDPTDAAPVGTFNSRPAVLPPAPLAPLAIGQSDVAPYVLSVSGMNLVSTHAKAAEELGNPQAYVTGRFDTAFALVVVLPLVLLVLLFDLASGARERGTLRLVLAQPIRPDTFMWAKAGLRWALVVGVAWASVLAGLGLFGANLGAAWGALGVALASVALYAAFWTALAAWVAGRGWASATNALALAAMWAALVVVLPGLIGAVSGALAPVPSRAALVEAQRDAATRWGGHGPDLLIAYYEANPGSRPEGFDPEAINFPLHYTAIQDAMQDTLGPVLRRYDDALAAQERLAGGLAILSPAALLQNTLATVAGTDHARHATYLRQVETFHIAHRDFFAPRAYQRISLTAADYKDMPVFAFQDPGNTAARTLWPLVGLFALTVGLVLLAAPGLRRIATH